MVIHINPFTPSFGQIPPYMAGRSYIVNEILRAFDNGPGDPNLATIFIGARGTGKTALLSLLAEQATAHGWISASVSAMPGMLDDIIERAQESAGEFVDSPSGTRLRGISIGQLFSVEWENEGLKGNWRTRMNRILKVLGEHDVGLLITVDEVRVNLDEMIQLASVYQHFVREGKKVALLMAGLPHQVSALLRNESVSFLRRACQYHFGRIDDYEVRDALRKTIEEGGRIVCDDALDQMVEASEGFPYMMQLVGFRAWEQSPNNDEITLGDVENGIKLAGLDMRARILDATYRELSDGDLSFLEAMLSDKGASRTADIADRMGVSSNYASQYRSRLLEQGIIGERGRGLVGFDIPFFKGYLREKAEEEDLGLGVR